MDHIVVSLFKSFPFLPILMFKLFYCYSRLSTLWPLPPPPLSLAFSSRHVELSRFASVLAVRLPTPDSHALPTFSLSSHSSLKTQLRESWALSAESCAFSVSFLLETLLSGTVW